MLFADRADAGRQLAARLEHLRGEPVVVLGLPRGGVPVALEVARALGAPLDVIVVRKLGVPFQPELGMGAVGEDGVRVINREVVRAVPVSADELAAVQAREQAQVQARAARYRVRLPAPATGRPDRCGGRRRHRHRVHRKGRLPGRPGARRRPGGTRRAGRAARVGSADRGRRRRTGLRGHPERLLRHWPVLLRFFPGHRR